MLQDQFLDILRKSKEYGFITEPEYIKYIKQGVKYRRENGKFIFDNTIANKIVLDNKLLKKIKKYENKGRDEIIKEIQKKLAIIDGFYNNQIDDYDYIFYDFNIYTYEKLQNELKRLDKYIDNLNKYQKKQFQADISFWELKRNNYKKDNNYADKQIEEPILQSSITTSINRTLNTDYKKLGYSKFQQIGNKIDAVRHIIKFKVLFNIPNLPNWSNLNTFLFDDIVGDYKVNIYHPYVKNMTITNFILAFSDMSEFTNNYIASKKWEKEIQVDVENTAILVPPNDIADVISFQNIRTTENLLSIDIDYNYDDILLKKDFGETVFYDHKYIDNPIDIKNHIYLKDNFRPNSCLLTILIYLYYGLTKIERNLTYTKKNGIEIDKGEYMDITYPNLCKYFGIPDLPSDNAITLKQFKAFFEDKNIKLSCFNMINQVVFRYTPEIQSKNYKNSVFLLIHNEHATLLNKNLDKLKRKDPKVKIIKEKVGSSNYYIPTKKTDIDEINMLNYCHEDLFNFVLDKLLCEEEKIYKIVSRDLDELLPLFIEKNIYPQVNFDEHQINYINYKNIFISNSKDKNSTYEEDLFNNVNEYKNYKQLNSDFCSWLINTNNLSKYNPDVIEFEKNYPIKPIISLFKDTPSENKSKIIDCNLSYASNLFNIKYFPQINFFDTYQEYDNHKIENETLYILDLDPNNKPIYNILAFGVASGRVRTYGTLLNNMKCQLNYNIVFYKRPSNLIKSNSQYHIKKVLNNSITQDKDKNMSIAKKIINCGIGKLGKKKNTISNTTIFRSAEEANNMYNLYGGKVLLDNKFYLWNNEITTPLNTGFLPIHELVYCHQNLKMLNLYIDLERANIPVYGMRTDCFYIGNNRNIRSKYLQKFNIPIENKNKILNTFKIEKDKLYPTKMFDYNYQYDLVNPPTNIINNIQIDDEYNITDLPNRTIVKAEIAGSGKSHTLKNIFPEKSRLFITPFNKLSEINNLENIKSITLCKLLGLDKNGQKSFNKSLFDTKDYDIIVFDEVYLYSLSNLEKIHYYMNNHNKLYFATGDFDQLEPLNMGNNIKNKDIYIDNAINILFPNVVNLKICKRLNNEKDRQKIYDMKYDLLKTDISIVDFCKKYNIKTINNIVQLDTDINITYFNFRKNAINSYLDRLYKLKNNINSKFYKGQQLTAKKYFKSKDIQLGTNYSYYVNDIYEDENLLEIVSEFDDMYLIPLDVAKEYLTNSYAFTLYSVQGISLDKNFTIFDSNLCYTDRKYIWTAITRARNLEQVRIFIHNQKEQDDFISKKLIQYFNLQIQELKKNDRLIFDNIDKNKYITAEFIFNKLNEIKYRCMETNQKLDLYINDNILSSNIKLDLIDLTQPAYFDNIKIICN